jgi:hypothetical protein
MKRTYEFSGYTLRPAEDVGAAIVLATEWTKADPDHAGRVSPTFWILDGYLLSDSEGPLFFFKGLLLTGWGMEVHLQFPPYDNRAMKHRLRHRISQGLIEGTEWLEKKMMAGGIRYITFESKSPALIRFCEKRLGFTHEAGKLRKSLSTNPQTGVISGQHAHVGD